MMNDGHNKLTEIIETAATRLARVGVRNAKEEAITIVEFYTKSNVDSFSLSESAEKEIYAAIRLREQRTPTERILGKTFFGGVEIIVKDNVFKPYPETENMVEHAARLLDDPTRTYRILDLGTGTGCILLALLHAVPNASGLGIDNNKDAISLANENASLNHLSARAQFKLNHWGDNIYEEFDLIISNPPRVPTKHLSNLIPEMREYDPPSAVDGGNDGLHYFRMLAKTSQYLLKPDGYCVCQVGLKYVLNAQSTFRRHGFLKTKVNCNQYGLPASLTILQGIPSQATLIKRKIRRIVGCYRACSKTCIEEQNAKKDS